MLGIALIIMLGFILLRYMPRKIEGETRFHQSLFWAKIGVACFIGQIIWMLTIGHFSLALALNRIYGSPLEGFMAYITKYSLFPFDGTFFSPHMLLFFILTFLCPIVFAGLTHIELVKPLSERKAPNQDWFHLIGIFTATCIGVFYSQSLSNGIVDMLQTLPVVFFYFSIPLIGIFAVETSRYKISFTPS
jgi:hypothetical protein